MRLIQSAHATMAPFVGSLDERLSPALREDVSFKRLAFIWTVQTLDSPPPPLYYAPLQSLNQLREHKNKLLHSHKAGDLHVSRTETVCCIGASFVPETHAGIERNPAECWNLQGGDWRL